MENKNKRFPEDPEAGKSKNKSSDFTSTDNDADKTASDNDSDGTVKKSEISKSKFDVDPDSTGIDTKADKTKN